MLSLLYFQKESIHNERLLITSIYLVDLVRPNSTSSSDQWFEEQIQTLLIPVFVDIGICKGRRVNETGNR